MNPLPLLLGLLTALLPTAAQETPKPLARSAILRQGGPLTEEMRVPLSGARELVLVVEDAGDGISHDWAAWVDPVLVTSGGEQPLTALKWTQARAGHGKVRVDLNCEGGPLRVSGQERRGFGVHAHSVIRFPLPPDARELRVLAALDDGGHARKGARTSVRFSVWDREPAPENPAPEVTHVPPEMFTVDGELEITLWASSPLLVNPTNIDIDAAGRIWVAEGANYRGSRRRPAGDRIVVVQDSDGDGRADQSHVFVQEEKWTSPLGVAVIGNRVVVSMAPSLIVYTDVDGDLRFDPAVDRREVFLTGFEGSNHDHSLHSVTVGPDGHWIFNCGNMGGEVTDRSGRTFRLGSPYQRKDLAGKPSDDGHVYLGGTAFRVRPDGTRLTPIGHNFRNSYEQTVTSFGDVFQNDNDDPPACRTTWLMEYGNLGFASADGTRTWGADKRPGQSTAVAEWRQEDPGVLPAGDVYGGGSPTGIVFVENSALGPRGEGLLVSCEPARNTLFGYHPKPSGAGIALERFTFLTTNPEEEFAGVDFKGGGAGRQVKMLFRPSDVAVGPDGALYVADWFDPRVGGHGTLDPHLLGAIYRIAPKGFRPVIPPHDLSTPAGAARALRNPAVNVRATGGEALRAFGAAALPELRRLLADPSPWFRARALYVLADLPGEGRQLARKSLADPDPSLRIAALRALRRTGDHPVDLAQVVARDADPGVRREALLGLRDVPFAEQRAVWLTLLNGFDGVDRWYLEALGTAVARQEAEAYAAARPQAPAPEWTPAQAALAWRLHPEAAAADLAARAGSPTLSRQARQQALDGLAFIPSRDAAEAMLELARQGPEDLREQAVWWVRNADLHRWRAYGVAAALKSGATPAKSGFQLPADLKPVNLPPTEEIAKLSGSLQRGRDLYHGRGLCTACHAVGESGGDIGPNLAGIGTRLTPASLLEAMVTPSASIALGFEMTVVTRRDGTAVGGLLTGSGDPLLVKAISGEVTAIDARDAAKIEKAPASLMPPAGALGLDAQAVADLVRYLESLR
jgi:putative membrane-bound dehydrogenase-like protein